MTVHAGKVLDAIKSNSWKGAWNEMMGMGAHANPLLKALDMTSYLVNVREHVQDVLADPHKGAVLQRCMEGAGSVEDYRDMFLEFHADVPVIGSTQMVLEGTMDMTTWFMVGASHAIKRAYDDRAASAASVVR